jgi:hypothetical protein
MKPRLWLFLVGVILAWYIYETYHQTLWDTVETYTGNVKRGGYFLLGGIILYAFFFHRGLMGEIFSKAAALDNDPRLNKVNIPISFEEQNYQAPGKRTQHKRNVSALLKKKIAASQQWRCGSCGQMLDETYEVDHRMALEHGGTNDVHNLWALCPHCHRKKTVAERISF